MLSFSVLRIHCKSFTKGYYDFYDPRESVISDQYFDQVHSEKSYLSSYYYSWSLIHFVSSQTQWYTAEILLRDHVSSKLLTWILDEREFHKRMTDILRRSLLKTKNQICMSHALTYDFFESCQKLIWYQIRFEWRPRHPCIIIFTPTSSEPIYRITNPLVNPTKSYFLRLVRPVARRQVIISSGYWWIRRLRHFVVVVEIFFSTLRSLSQRDPYSLFLFHIHGFT